jgi:tetratricopeptide (TPR) repeat protein
MQHATAETVLGNFNEARHAFQGVTSTFFKRDGRFFVRTDGPDGRLADFEIRYTFGLAPLQQYLVELPGGRLQALAVGWDTRPKEAGGQRWFRQYPDEKIDHRDELHWTRRSQNWNFMCADCHSTDLRKGYDPSGDRFDTRWAELNVGCEACHGPASNHVAWAANRGPDPTRGLTVALDQRREVTWTIDPATGNAVRSTPNERRTEVDVCAQCHSRRAQIAEGYHAGKPFLDHYLPALLEPPLYHPDGQQREEVYVWGSYLQSRMHAKGVTCSDCHEPHSQQLRAPGDAVCAQCHLPAKYATAAHHHHGEAGPGSACVDCHMPATDYMVIDPRRDHSFRVPRPDRTVTIGTPNACSGCHADRPAAWAAERIQAWTGSTPGGQQTFAEAFSAAHSGDRTAAPRLAELLADPAQPALVQASAAKALGGFAAPELPSALRAGLAHRDPLVRLGSLQALDGWAPQGYARAVVPLLGDAYRTNRIEAVRLLAGMPTEQLAAVDRVAFDSAAREYEASLAYNADRPESRTALGTFQAARGRMAEAEQSLRAAIAMDPLHVPAYVNLADVARAQGRDADAEAVLREGLAAIAGSAGPNAPSPQAAGLYHALGLTLVRLGRNSEALDAVATAARLAPDSVRFAYVHAVALNSAGDVEGALTEIDRALALRPDDRDLLIAGALFARDAGLAPRAAEYADRLRRAYPDDPEAAALAAELVGPGP